MTGGARLLLILDYDGTLTPIVPWPDAAVLAASVRGTLSRLAASGRARVAILSGRALADLRARVRLANVVYGGCHGLEIAGGGVRFRHPQARVAGVAAAARALAAGARSISGACVEWKGLAVSLHYRRVAAARRGEVRALAACVARRAPNLTVVSGREVFDLVPRVAWDKGRAALWIARRVARAAGPAPPLLLYAGDDATDERAFAALKGRGVTVRVGEGASLADHAVHGVREVHALLRWIGRAIG